MNGWRALLMATGIVVVACGATPGSAIAPGPGAGASPTAALTKIVVTYGSVAGDVLPTYVALEAGLFKANGLDVDLQLITSSTAAVAALVSKQADFTQAGGSEAISANVGGADVVIVSITSPTYSYILEGSPDVKSAQDLKGKKVGISTAGSSSDVAVRVALRSIGIDPDRDVSIVAVGGVPERTAALQNGAIQATVANPPESLTLERAGFKPILDLPSLKLPASLQGTIVRRDLIQTRPDLVQRYVDSIVQAIALMKKDRKVGVDALKKYFKSSDDQAMSATVDFYVNEVFPALPAPRVELFADALATLSARNDKVKGFDVSKIIDASFVQKAGERGLSR